MQLPQKATLPISTKTKILKLHLSRKTIIVLLQLNSLFKTRSLVFISMQLLATTKQFVKRNNALKYLYQKRHFSLFTIASIKVLI